jgi:tRNA 2-selenouridine synthase
MAVALQRIRKKLGGKVCDELAGNLERWELEPFMEGLVCDYYDKVYYKNRDWEGDYNLSMEDFDTAARELEGFLTPSSPDTSSPALPDGRRVSPA